MENRVRNLFLGLSALLASIILIGQAQAQSAPVGDCSSVHKACTTCQFRRISGTRSSTALMCSMCAPGWRLRRDKGLKTCDCAPGFTLNGTLGDPTSWCVPCPVGPYCPGGSAQNPLAEPQPCITGLATKVQGAKSSSQCYTVEGFGRTTVALPNGTVTVVAYTCPKGTYNVGGNTAGCQQCGTGLTTIDEGSTNASACVAPPGMYLDIYRGVGRWCQKGTYTETYNTLPACNACLTGFTTAGERSNSSAQCDKVLPGYYMVNSTYAAECPAGSYQDMEGTVYDCNACPYGYMTRATGTGGNAECLAPPGWELKENAIIITQCEVGYYKAGWNRNPCVLCGAGLSTEDIGSISFDDCLIKPGYGIKSVSPPEAVKCEQNFYSLYELRPIASDSRCIPCEVNMFTLDYLMGINSTEGYSYETDCVVKPGWGYEQSGIVEMCKEGLYNEGYNREPCHECPTGYATIETGADTPDMCVIQEGWALDVTRGNAIPKPCDAGTFSTGGTQDNPNGNCTSCPAGYTTQRDESVSISDCNVCAAGFGGANCTVCDYDTYSPKGQQVCEQCASGTVSARMSIDNTRCLPAIIDADLDYFPLSDDSQWTPDTSTTSVACQESCRTNPLCATFRFSTDPHAPKCELLLETANGQQMVGFKAGGGSDYVLYRVPAGLEVGNLISDAGVKTPKECMASCSEIGPCEVVSMLAANLESAAAGPCKLYGSVLDADWVGMYHVTGERLYSDLLVG